MLIKLRNQTNDPNFLNKHYIVFLNMTKAITTSCTVTDPITLPSFGFGFNLIIFINYELKNITKQKLNCLLFNSIQFNVPF